MFTKKWLNRKFNLLIRTLKTKNKMKLFNFWSWPAELIDDIRTWFIVRSAIKEDLTKSILDSFKYEIRVDKIGRLYTVLNVSEEFYEADKQKLAQYWLVEQLRELDEILLQCNLNDLLYPSVELIKDPNTFAYLIVLSPPAESLSFWKFLFWIFNLSLVAGSLLLLNKIVFILTSYGMFDLFNLLF